MRRSRPAPSAPRSAKRLPSDLDRNSQEMLPVSASRISLSSRSAAHTDPITCHLFLKKGRRSPCQSLLGSQFLEIHAQCRELDSSRMRLIAGALHLSGSSTPRNSHRLMILSNETAPEGRTQRPVRPPDADPGFSPAGQRRFKDGPRPSRTTDWRRAVVVTRHGAVTYIGAPPPQSTPLLTAICAAIRSSPN